MRWPAARRVAASGGREEANDIVGDGECVQRMNVVLCGEIEARGWSRSYSDHKTNSGDWLFR